MRRGGRGHGAVASGIHGQLYQRWAFNQKKKKIVLTDSYGDTQTKELVPCMHADGP